MSNWILVSDELTHYGVKGQEWGERKYQNSDGSLTSLGRQHYGYSTTPNRETTNVSKYEIGKKSSVDKSKLKSTKEILDDIETKKKEKENSDKSSSNSTSSSSGSGKKKGSGGKKSSSKKADKKNEEQKKKELEALQNLQNGGFSQEHIDLAARQVIQGVFGDGAKRKELLGPAYEIVQKRVNELLKEQKKKEQDKEMEDKKKNTTMKHSYILVPKEDELFHHGINGQKWGKRNGPPYPLNSNVSTGKSLKKRSENSKDEVKGSEDRKNSVKKDRMSKDDIKNLSDEELDKMLRRIEKEKKLTDFMEYDKEGEKYTKDLLKEAGRKAMTEVIGKTLGTALGEIVKEMIKSMLTK